MTITVVVVMVGALLMFNIIYCREYSAEGAVAPAR